MKTHPFLSRRTSALRLCRRWLASAALACTSVASASPLADDPASGARLVPLQREYAAMVDKQRAVPPQAAVVYAWRLDMALWSWGLQLNDPQFVVLVDRAPAVQTLFLFWGASTAGCSLVGASPVSTGTVGRFEHFLTPLGVYEHSLKNLDFRAEGTRNELGIRGYGRKGSRVYDFGWVTAPKGWGDHALSEMRLQMHSTDPDVLEPRLGTPQSKGCIRIPASLNEFLDVNGVLDAAYDALLEEGARLWMLRADRRASFWAGRWLVVIDTASAGPPL